MVTLRQTYMSYEVGYIPIHVLIEQISNHYTHRNYAHSTYPLRCGLYVPTFPLLVRTLCFCWRKMTSWNLNVFWLYHHNTMLSQQIMSISWNIHITLRFSTWITSFGSLIPWSPSEFPLFTIHSSSFERIVMISRIPPCPYYFFINELSCIIFQFLLVI